MLTEIYIEVSICTLDWPGFCNLEMTRLMRANSNIFKGLGSSRRVSFRCKKGPFLVQISVQINTVGSIRAWRTISMNVSRTVTIDWREELRIKDYEGFPVFPC